MSEEGKLNNPAESPELENVGSSVIEVSSEDLLDALIKGYGKNGKQVGKEKFAKVLSDHLKQVVKKHPVFSKYNIMVLFDNSILLKSDSDNIYEATSNLSEKNKPLLLVLLSNGGEPGSAYLIGKLCRESSDGNFVVVVPRHAKSAATLLACAANEIHMGSMSELGPIDPQINKMPALGLKNSIEHIAELVKKMPETAEMFAQYLNLSIKPIQIGYYERVAESATQYAERLLQTHSATLESDVADIAKKLVYGYKDHGFVIDKTEAEAIFGSKTIKYNTDEYKLGSALYDALSEMERWANLLGYNFYFIGSLDSQPHLVKQRS